MEQITLNFDASEFDAFESVQEYFAHRTRLIKDDTGRAIKLGVQAMEMDMSPSQYSHKLNESNNTMLTLRDAEKHTEIFGDIGWVHFLIFKHILKKKRNREELLKLKAEIDAQLREAD